MKKIKLGYKVGTQEEVFIHPSHLIVTGITQLSGKTTTLEALILRSKAKAIIFKTKVGEKSFSNGSVVPPFFRDRSDYEFVRSLIEAYSKEKLVIEKGTLMTLCKGSKSLVEIKRRVDEKLVPVEPKVKPPTGFMLEIYTRLQHYLENLLPQIQYANFSSTLNLIDGINIMDLEKFSPEAQSLIIRSVADEVMKNSRDTIIVIPEAWKFIPQTRNNPCKEAVESFIRQGATNNNFIWLDSQDMTGVDKTPLKQISTWILGYQSEINEVKHTLDQISIPKKSKPKEDDIMNLAIGQFFLSSRDQVVKVYVQPSWLSDKDAAAVASGKMDISEAMINKPMPSFNFPIAIQPAAEPKDNAGFATKKELSQMRIDFFTKIEQLVNDINNFVTNFTKNHSSGAKQVIDYDELAGLVSQKMPQQNSLTLNQPSPVFNTDDIIKQVLAKLPTPIGGSVTYTVAPLKKIKKDFLNEAKNKIISDVDTLTDDGKKVLKYLESRGQGAKTSELVAKCFLMKDGGTQRAKSQNACKELVAIGCIRQTTNGYFPNLKERITDLLANHEATEDEIKSVYDHILMEMLK